MSNEHSVAVLPAPVEGAEPLPVGADQIQLLIESLVHQRQRLRGAGAPATELEANRLAIAYWHRRLGTELGASARR